MVKNISFSGKAYFLGDTAKTMTANQKERIENYAKKQSKETDVVVIGQVVDTLFEYQGKTYDSSSVSTNLDNEIGFDITTKEGKIFAPINKVKMRDIPLQIWNAYIISDYHKRGIQYTPNKKQFDFTDGAKSTIILPNGRLDDDINF